MNRRTFFKSLLATACLSASTFYTSVPKKGAWPDRFYVPPIEEFKFPHIRKVDMGPEGFAEFKGKLDMVEFHVVSDPMPGMEFKSDIDELVRLTNQVYEECKKGDTYILHWMEEDKLTPEQRAKALELIRRPFPKFKFPNVKVPYPPLNIDL